MVLSGPVSAATVKINDSSVYNTSTISLNQQIQNIINSASKGDTIEFTGTQYESLSLSINKKLNIISKVHTKITSNLTKPIFLISGSASYGTNITGLNLQSNCTDGVVIKNTGKININENKLSSKNGNGINVINSTNVNITNNQISNSICGLSITNSKNVDITGNIIKTCVNNGVTVLGSSMLNFIGNQIYANVKDGISVENSKTVSMEENTISKNENNGITLKNCFKSNISNNEISQNQGHGIYFEEKVDETQITSNNIINNQGIGINLDKSGANTYINRNKITGNKIGIQINDSSDNLVITQNQITGSVRNALDETSGIGINFGVNYWYFSTFNVNNNNVFGNQRREVEIKDTLETVIFGANWYGHSDPTGCNLCPKLKTQYIKAVITQSTDGSYRATFYTDYTTGMIASTLPSFEIYFYMSDGTVRTALAESGIASIKVESPLTVTLVRTTNQRHEPKDFSQVAVEIPSDDDDPDDPVNPGGGVDGGGSDNGPGTGGDSVNNGNSNSGSNSGSASNDGTSTSNLALGEAAEVAAASSGSSAGQDESSSSQGKSSTVQELILNYPVKDTQILSILGVVLLIFLIVLVYYRKGLMLMIRNSK